jgi:hypothetical protein
LEREDPTAAWGGRRWPDMRGHAVSDATEKESAAALRAVAGPAAEVGPGGETTRAGE